jgi:phospholipid/cholesterol/gamma-HCH transport system ATP-binding protein
MSQNVNVAKITVRNLCKNFGTKNVLNNINMEVNEGESYVIMGGSGSGKSVLIKTILGLHLPEEGSQVLINGQDMTFVPIEHRSDMLKQTGVLFQGGALFDSMTVWQNISFTTLQSKGIGIKEARVLAMEKLQAVGLEERVLDLYPAELSGGMVKRVALARAIANDPKLIFFDEPTAGLDPITSSTISELIKSCSKKLGATTITITHDMHCARRIADKAALIYKGKFIWSGKGEEIDHSGNDYVNQFVAGSPHGPITNSTI